MQGVGGAAAGGGGVYIKKNMGPIFFTAIQRAQRALPVAEGHQPSAGAKGAVPSSFLNIKCHLCLIRGVKTKGEKETKMSI